MAESVGRKERNLFGRAAVVAAAVASLAVPTACRSTGEQATATTSMETTTQPESMRTAAKKELTDVANRILLVARRSTGDHSKVEFTTPEVTPPGAEPHTSVAVTVEAPAEPDGKSYRYKAGVVVPRGEIWPFDPSHATEASIAKIPADQPEDSSYRVNWAGYTNDEETHFVVWDHPEINDPSYYVDNPTYAKGKLVALTPDLLEKNVDQGADGLLQVMEAVK